MNDDATPGSAAPTYEVSCKRRIDQWHDQLKAHAQAPDLHALRQIKAAIDADLALAEFKIKFREADHAKAWKWWTVALPIAGSVFGAAFGAWVGHH